MPSAIDFWDLEHGLEMLANAVDQHDRIGVARSLEIMATSVNEAKGDAARDLQSLLFRTSMYPEEATRADVDRLRAAFAQLAIDYANGHESTSHKRHRKAVSAGRQGGKAPRLHKQIERERWEQEMRKMLERNKHRTPADMARAIADLPDVEAKPDTIARYLRRVLKEA